MKPTNVLLECGHERQVYWPGKKIRDGDMVNCLHCPELQKVASIATGGATDGQRTSGANCTENSDV